MTIRDGLITNLNAPITHGGGILNEGTLTLDMVTITSNIVLNYGDSGQTAHGGGIFNSGSLTLDQCKIVGNTAVGYFDEYWVSEALGGGIYNSGQLTIISSDIINNQVQADFGDDSLAYGGGVYDCGTTSIITSLIASNYARSSVFNQEHGQAISKGGGCFFDR